MRDLKPVLEMALIMILAAMMLLFLFITLNSVVIVTPPGDWTISLLLDHINGWLSMLLAPGLIAGGMIGSFTGAFIGIGLHRSQYYPATPVIRVVRLHGIAGLSILILARLLPFTILLQSGGYPTRDLANFYIYLPAAIAFPILCIVIWLYVPRYVHQMRDKKRKNDSQHNEKVQSEHLQNPVQSDADLPMQHTESLSIAAKQSG